MLVLGTHTALSELLGIDGRGEVETPGVAGGGVLPVHEALAGLAYPRSWDKNIGLQIETNQPRHEKFEDDIRLPMTSKVMIDTHRGLTELVQDTANRGARALLDI